MTDTSHRRVRHPKVKTGCITCRKRRVKCDETHPNCIRCLKYGVECGGYLPGRRRPPSSAYGSAAQQVRALVPKDQGPMMLQPVSTLFDSNLDYQYFRLFSDRIASEICPYFNPEPWSRMLLQACINDPSIRHAAVAVGALGKWKSSGETLLLEMDRPSPGTTRELRTPGFPSDDLKASRMHRTYALEQYQKALRRMPNVISAGTKSMRTALIMCIITVCFEAILGYHETAAKTLYFGLKMVQDWVAEQNRSLECHPQGFSSPAPDIIDHFLVQSFGRMEITAMSVFDPRGADVHSILKDEGRETVQAMPNQFSNMEQARIYLDLIKRRIGHFRKSVHAPRTSADSLQAPNLRPSTSSPEQAGAWDDVVAAMPWCDGKIPLSSITTVLSSPALTAEQASLVEELNNWTEAFTSILTSARANGGQEAISALTLWISGIESQILLHAAFFINESAYDVFMLQFRQIVKYAAILLEIQSSLTSSPEAANSFKEPLTHFIFDIGIIPPLYTVITKCRDYKIRRQALKLMDDNPRREGVWDSVATAAIGRWVIELEEEGARVYKLNAASASTSPPVSVSNGDGDSSPSSSRSRTLSRGPSTINPTTFPLDGNCNHSPTNANFREEFEREELPIPEEMRVRKAAMRFDLPARKANFGCLQMDFEKWEFVHKVKSCRF